jgi:DNA-binding beta-propeller fold protein YncE
VPERFYSPIDLAIVPGGRLALTANHTADSVSLVDLDAARVLAELPCGRKPAGVACSPDGRRAAVSNLWSGTLTLLEMRGPTLHAAGTVAVGAAPRGLVFAPDGDSIYVALAGAGEVVQVGWQGRQIVRRWPAAGEPRRLALTTDGRYLAAASARSAQVRCWDTQTGKPLWEHTITDAFTLHGLAFSPDGKELVATHCHDRHHAISASNIREGWAIDNRLTRLTREPDQDTEYWQIALDVRNKAVADPCAAAFSAGGDWLAITASGTHELVVLQAKAIPWSPGEPGDFLDASLERDDGKCRRVPLGGRPLAVQFAGTGTRAVVANYLLDAVQIVDVRSGTLVRQIPLGTHGQAMLPVERRGEAIFYDATRSIHQWFSCHTCHPDGHTSGRAFDTLNDDSYGNPKLTPSLRGVSHTGPWTWHGWQKDLGKAVEKSMTDTLFGPRPSADDVAAVLAFLKTLDHPPNPNRGPGGALSVASERGQVLFRGKAGCVRCHHGEHYTSPRTFDVGLDADGSPFAGWNPPSLRDVYDRGPYLHDGRADSLDELLRLHHRPEKLGGQALTPAERHDLVEFLRAL